MSGSLKPQDTLAAIGRVLADNDRRIRALENLPSGGGDSTHPGTGSNSMAVGPSTIASGDDSQAGGCSAQALGRNSTAFGFAAIALGDFSTAYGTNTYAEEEGVAVGGGAAAVLSAVAVGGDDGGGDGAAASGTHATAVGSGTRAHGARSICLGSSAVVNDDDTGKVKVDAFEVEPSSGGSESSLILSDSAGARWAVTVDTTGHLTTTAL